MALATILAVPAPVELAGREYLVAPLTLGALALLDGWLASRVPDPTEAVGPFERDPEPATWHRRARAAHAAALALPLLGSPGAAEVLATAEGLAAYLWTALAPHNPRLTPRKAERLALRLTAAEWARLERVAWGVDPAEAVRRLAEGPGDDDDDEAEAGPSAGPGGWEGAVASLLAAHPGWTFADLEAVTVAQLAALRRARARPRRCESAQELAAAVDRHRRAWYSDEERAEQP